VLEEESERGGYIPLDDHDLRELAKAASSSKSIVAREPTAVKLTQLLQVPHRQKRVMFQRKLL